MTFWGSVVLCALLLVVGLRLLRGRRRAIGGAVLVLALVAPLAARAVTLPFTFTNGTVADASQVNANFAALATNGASGFVTDFGPPDGSSLATFGFAAGVDVVRPKGGEYCFKLGFLPTSAVASLSTKSPQVVVQTLPGGVSSGPVSPDCPSDHQDALVQVSSFYAGGFSVAFR
jgi:hypothetical protein